MCRETMPGFARGAGVVSRASPGNTRDEEEAVVATEHERRLAEYERQVGELQAQYLVEALAHCSDCHSPRNIMGAIRGKALFTGSEVDGFYAPDIASGALAKTWTKDNLAQFLKTGASPQRGSVFGRGPRSGSA